MSDSELSLQKLKPSSSNSFLVQSLVKQLCRHMVKKPQDQKRVYDVICEKLHEMNLIDQSYSVEEYDFMRKYYQRSLIQLVSIAKSVIVGSNDSLLPLPRLTQEAYEHLISSRYRNDYEEVDYVAKGGFGRVYRARHKLDGMEYAVKKICIQCQNINTFLQNLREVKMLARLHHPNIVAYKAAWVEMVDPVNSSPETGNSNSNGSPNIVFEEPSHEEDNANGACGGESQNQNNTNSASQNEDKSDTFFSASEESDTSEDKMVCRYQDTRIMAWNSSWDSAMLYVQMQLCERTLRQWLDDRNLQIQNSVDIKQSIMIFQQIVQGVCYIHSQDIVHHDIKPCNIFINSDLSQVQVGDFGLACWLQRTDNVALVTDTLRHKVEIGTKLYAAPEQIRGKCDRKSDLYSLGIVLFELLQPFRTYMERSKMIDQLKAGKIPPELSLLAPKWAQLISHLMEPLPKLRPSIDELQKMLIPLIKETNEESESIDSKNKKIQQLLAEISQRDHDILQRDHEISQRDCEISQRDREISQRDHEISQRNCEIKELKKRVSDLETKIVSGSSKG